VLRVLSEKPSGMSDAKFQHTTVIQTIVLNYFNDQNGLPSQRQFLQKSPMQRRFALIDRDALC
jgi:hypothetical protein